MFVGRETTLDIVLRPEGISQTVTVEGGENVTDTSSARIGAEVNGREVEGLPINGHQLSQLYLQAPGSSNGGTGTFDDIHFSGRSNEQNAIRYDGIDGTAVIDTSPGNLNGEVTSPFRLQTSLEGVQEFRVESNTYPAEYGTGTGGQISIITKSGSNEFHGSLFEYLRNDALDARNFFDLSKPSKLRLNQFGGSLDGPIIKNKLFFFSSYEGYRLRSGINIIEAVPKLTLAAGDPLVQPLLAAFRGPGAFLLPGASSNPRFDVLQIQSNVMVNENSASARFDYKFNDRYSLYARYFRDEGRNDQPEGVTGRHVAIRAVPQNAVFAFQGTFTPTVINEFKFGFNEALTRVNGIAPVISGIDLSATTINITGSIANTGIAGQGASSGIAVPGGLVRQNSASNGRGSPYTPYSLTFVDNLNWVKGSHSLKFGGEIRPIRLYTDRLGGTTYTYADLDAFLRNDATVQYLGDVSAPSPHNNGATGVRLMKQAYYIGYAQDEWKLRKDLTLNYGLRYEYYTVLHEARNLNYQFDTVRGVRLPVDRPFYISKKTNFQPRVGIAWSPKLDGTGFFGGGRTVIRAGFGLYNGPGQTEDQIQPIESDRVGFTIRGAYGRTDLNALINRFATDPNRQFQPRAYAPEYSIPERVYQYSVSVQQELPYKVVVTAAYVGSQGRNFFLRSITNQIVEVRPNGTIRREFDQVQPDGTLLKPFAEIDYKTSGGRDSYNALQLSLGRRFSTGLTLNSQYTLSRSFGNSQGSNEALTAGNLARRLPDFDYDLGYNAFDIRHTFNLSALYSMPFGQGQRFLSGLSGIGQALLGDWEVGTIINARSGIPLDVRVVRPDVAYVDSSGMVWANAGPGRTAVINTPGGGATRNVRRPDLVPGVNPYLNNDRQYLNPAAFAIPKPGTFGNLQRGALRGPNFRQVDIILNKRFRISESARVEFRAEFFNLFNQTNFFNPPVTLPNALPSRPNEPTGPNLVQPGQPFRRSSAGVFGILNQTVGRTVGLGTNRQIQFALRLNF